MNFPRLMLTVVALLASGTCWAQTWPSRPIRWIVPAPPGGSTDIAVRPVAEYLSQVLGQPVIVENRPGAGTHIGAEFVANATPDGYTLLAGVDTMGLKPALFPSFKYDPIKDFAPVTQLARQPLVIAAHSSTNATTLAELVTLAKARPGVLSYASSGTGTNQHLLGEWFKSLAGIKMEHISYKGGGQAITDFVGGQVPVAALGSAPVLPHHKTGRVKILAVSTRARSPSLPDVPTLAEAGYKDLYVEQWVGLFVPGGTPEAIIQRLHSEVVKALAQPILRERYAGVALEPVGNKPDELAALLRGDVERYTRLIDQLKIKLE